MNTKKELLVSTEKSVIVACTCLIQECLIDDDTKRQCNIK